MNIVMLGWEYPPHISGGLGTACEGLTKALSKLQVSITFVLPHSMQPRGDGTLSFLPCDAEHLREGSTPVTPIEIPAHLQPYWRPEDFESFMAGILKHASLGDLHDEYGRKVPPQTRELQQARARFSAPYAGGLFGEVERYAANVVERLRDRQFDLIHAHDWMTFPAAIALSQVSGKPFIAHVHSLEFDRSGTHGDRRIQDIESRGLHAAQAVIAVSYFTRSIIRQQHQVALEKIAVVHNGVYAAQVVNSYRRESPKERKKVLFLGRITFQKGPEYFVEAAAKVIPHVPQVQFVMAGTGDMLPRVMARVRELGLSDYFEFPGFLRGSEVEAMFSTAHLYVMPSVSEPFGISALEAISFDTPVIISRQSGVSEVLNHALKVDFWDVERMADLIINALLHEELRRDLVRMAREEVKELRWDAAALRTLEVYRKVLGGEAAGDEQLK